MPYLLLTPNHIM